MHTVFFLNKLVEHNQVLAYLVIFLGMVFEGEVILITTGVLARLGAFDLWSVGIFVLLGGLAKTVGMYYVGVFLHEKYNHNKYFRFVEKRVITFVPHFKERPFWSIFVSKFIIGINYLVLIFSGYNRINLKTYFKAEIISTIIWAPLLLSVGYFFGHTALGVSREMWKFSLVVLLLVIGFLIFDKLVAMVYKILGEFHNDAK